jgi:hypothetical protein
MAQSSFVVLLCLGAALAVLIGRRRSHVPTFGRYYVFTLVSLATIYAYVLLCDPWHETPGNPRVLLPLFAHVIALGALAWSDASALDGPWRRAALTLLVIGFVSMMRFDAVGKVVCGGAPRQGEGWEPTRLATSLSAREDWRRALDEVRRALAVPGADGLAVAFVDIPHEEYLKYWVGPLLYDRRTRVSRGKAPPPADLVVAPAGAHFDGWRVRERVTLRPDIVRDLLVPAGDE